MLLRVEHHLILEYLKRKGVEVQVYPEKNVIYLRGRRRVTIEEIKAYSKFFRVKVRFSQYRTETKDFEHLIHALKFAASKVGLKR